MSYVILPQKKRNDSLGIQTYNTLIDNLEDNLAALRIAHTEAGEHNTLDVPRAVATAYWDGANYNLRGNSAGITALAKSAVGEVTFTLSSTYFPFAEILARPMPMCLNDQPYIANAKVVSNTSVKVFLSKGTAWGAYDESFCLALHADPFVSAPSASWNQMSKISRTPKTGLQFGEFNKFTKNAAFLRKQWLVEHTSAGNHNAQQIPRFMGSVTWNGAAYVGPFNSPTYLTSITNPGVGIARLNFSAATFPNNPNPSVQIFVTPSYLTANTEQWIAFAPRLQITNTGNYMTSFDVYQWKKSATNTWTLTDGSFFYSFHCQPA